MSNESLIDRNVYEQTTLNKTEIKDDVADNRSLSCTLNLPDAFPRSCGKTMSFSSSSEYLNKSASQLTQSFYHLNDREEKLAKATAYAVVAASEGSSRTALTEVPLNLYHCPSESCLTIPNNYCTHKDTPHTDAQHWLSRNSFSSEHCNRPKTRSELHYSLDETSRKVSPDTPYHKVEPTGKITLQSVGRNCSEIMTKRPLLNRTKRHASERLHRPSQSLTASLKFQKSVPIGYARKIGRSSSSTTTTTLRTDNNVGPTGRLSKVHATVQVNNSFDDKTQSSPNLGSQDSSVFTLDEKPTSSFNLKEQFFSFFQPTGNKLAMKLFGTKMALNRERQRQEQHGKWIIHPCSNFRFYWDVIMLLLLIANLIILPVAISFFNEELTLHWIAFNCISDTVFLLDIAVNFRTGIIKNNYADEIILNPKEIASHYVKSWFFLDLLSSLPLDYIYLIFHDNESLSQFVHAGRALRILRFVKLLSLIRLLRLSRLVRYVNQWEEFLNVASKFLGIFNLVLLLLLLGHWNACLQFLIPMINDFPVNSWVSKSKLQDANWFDQYTWALFKAMSHMLSIGYGRYPPTSITEAWVTVVSMVTGATGYALFVGHAAALIQSFDCSKRLYREKFKQVDEYMAFRKLPRALRQRIASYYEHRYQGKMFNENEILGELSECLKEQIINYNCRALVAAVPFFTFADQNFVSEVIVKLKFEVFQPGDLIIKEGTIGSKMYFIQEGIVDIVTREGEIATSLSDGSYFGEICLLTNARRVASVRAATYCSLYSLDRASFLEVLDYYPLMRRTMESVAAERLHKIGRDPLVVSKRKDLCDDLKLVNEIVNQTIAEASDTEDERSTDPSKPSLTLRETLNRAKSRILRCQAHVSNATDETERFKEGHKSLLHAVQRVLVCHQPQEDDDEAASPNFDCTSNNTTSFLPEVIVTLAPEGADGHETEPQPNSRSNSMPDLEVSKTGVELDKKDSHC